MNIHKGKVHRKNNDFRNKLKNKKKEENLVVMKEREVKSRYETLIIQIKKIFKQCIRKRHTSEKVWLFECQKCTRTYEKETRVKEHILLNHNVNLGGKEKD